MKNKQKFLCFNLLLVLRFVVRPAAGTTRSCGSEPARSTRVVRFLGVVLLLLFPSLVHSTVPGSATCVVLYLDDDSMTCTPGTDVTTLFRDASNNNGYQTTDVHYAAAGTESLSYHKTAAGVQVDPVVKGYSDTAKIVVKYYDSGAWHESQGFLPRKYGDQTIHYDPDHLAVLSSDFFSDGGDYVSCAASGLPDPGICGVDPCGVTYDNTYTDFIEVCGGSADYVDTWDPDQCVGTCKTCAEIEAVEAQACADADTQLLVRSCRSIVKLGWHDVSGEPFAVPGHGESSTFYQCTDASIDDCAQAWTECLSICGGSSANVASYDCDEHGVTEPCSCLDGEDIYEPGRNDPDDYLSGSGDSEPPDGDSSEGETAFTQDPNADSPSSGTDNELLLQIAKNTASNADSDYTSMKNLQSIANNTGQTVDTLDRELNEINSNLKDVSNNTKLTGQQIEYGLHNLSDQVSSVGSTLEGALDDVKDAIDDQDFDVSGVETRLDDVNTNLDDVNTNLEDLQEVPADGGQSVLDSFDTDTGTLLDDAFSDMQDAIEAEMSSAPLDSSDLDGVENQLTGLIPSSGTCSPLVFETPQGDLTVGCDVSANIKTFLAFICAISTVFGVFALVYNEMRPNPVGGDK